MCGLAGFVGAGTAEQLRSMGAALAHRGPDGEGFEIDAASGLHVVHRRLAIIDRAGGAQPMWDAERATGVVFNGEIYNHVELRAQLEARGHVFASDHSDTEVLVHGYKEWGRDLPARLNGMFAFAVIDRRARRLFLARDHFGKKPLYYHCAPGLFAFASELTALLEHPGVPRDIDREAVKKLFAYGFVPSPRSLRSAVRRLPAGHHLTYELDRPGTVEVARYWEFAIEPPDRIPANAEAVWGEELRHLLSQAVRRRLMSDVPLGVFLSGGIDSSAVLAYATAAAQGRVETFAIGFSEASFDESHYARTVAGHFGAAHHEQMLSIDAARDLVPGVLGRLDEPFVDASVIPTYQLCAFARRRITVALGGDGGDELFAGYDPFRALGVARWFDAIVPGWMKGGVRRLADMLPVSQENMGLDFRIKRGLRAASLPPAAWNPAWLGPLEPAELRELFQEPVAVEKIYEEAIEAWESSRATHPVDRTLEFYTRFYLQDDILAKSDRASMQVSLELRSPFLDRDVAEFARRIPHDFKYRGGTTKYLLKSALRGVLPDSVIDRPKKGFGIPLTRWLRTWDEAAFAPGIAAAGNARWWAQVLREHREGHRDHRLALWGLLVLGAHGGGA